MLHVPDVARDKVRNIFNYNISDVTKAHTHVLASEIKENWK